MTLSGRNPGSWSVNRSWGWIMQSTTDAKNWNIMLPSLPILCAKKGILWVWILDNFHICLKYENNHEKNKILGSKKLSFFPQFRPFAIAADINTRGSKPRHFEPNNIIKRILE